jgi:beta-lactamase regulating signal transducer with metallopeptidase domain
MTDPQWIAGSFVGAVLGGGVVLAVWEVGLLALVYAAWKHARHRADPARRHRAALAALFGGLWLAAGSAVVLARAPAVAAPPAAAVGPYVGETNALAALASTADAVPPQGRRSDRLAAAMSAVAMLWGAAAGFLLARFAVGLLMAARLRRAAHEHPSPQLQAVLRRLATRLELTQAVSLRETEDVDTPAALGLRPVILLPRGIEQRLPGEHLEALIAHELAHVRRNDYLVGLLQTLADALLVLCPPARWLSDEARSAREQCCDDLAVAACGSASVYAEALGRLALLSVRAGPLPALTAGAAGVADRIRRILKGEPMPRLNRPRSLAVAAAVVAVVVTGPAVFVSAREAAGAASRRPEVASLPFGYVAHQPGAPVRVVSYEPAADGLAGRVRLRNVSERRVERVTVILVIELLPLRSAPAVLASSELIVSLEPGAAGTFEFSAMQTMEFERPEQLAPLMGREGRLQLFLSVRQATFGDGREWILTPNKTGRTANEVLHLPVSWVSRDLVGVPAHTAVDEHSCRDDRGHEYSHGALVPILDEPGRHARCDGGAWADSP